MSAPPIFGIASCSRPLYTGSQGILVLGLASSLFLRGKERAPTGQVSGRRDSLAARAAGGPLNLPLTDERGHQTRFDAKAPHRHSHTPAVHNKTHQQRPDPHVPPLAGYDSTLQRSPILAEGDSESALKHESLTRPQTNTRTVLIHAVA